MTRPSNAYRNFRGRRKFRQGRGRGSIPSFVLKQASTLSARDLSERMSNKVEAVREAQRLEAFFAFDTYTGGSPRLGWLINMHPVRSSWRFLRSPNKRLQF